MTDHTNLQYWKSPKNLNRRTAHWHADLQEYDFDILYILGKTNIPPNALSQLPGVDQGKEDNQQVMVLPAQKFKIASVTQEAKILVPPIDIIKRGIMNLIHNHPSMGHPGRDETLHKTQECYHWPNMKNWIANYVKGCAICQQNKIVTHCTKVPPYRIPTKLDARPFQRIAMDLIMGLPPIKGKDAILTIVDQGCSCVAIFLACDTTITGLGITQLYMDHMFRWFSLPDKIISDRDPRFTSHFRKALTKRLNIWQNLSTAFHPQTDGLSVLQSWPLIFIFLPFPPTCFVLLVTCSPLAPSCTAQTATQSPDKSPDESLDHSAVNYYMPLLCSLQHQYLNLSWTASSWWSYT